MFYYDIRVAGTYGKSDKERTEESPFRKRQSYNEFVDQCADATNWLLSSTGDRAVIVFVKIIQEVMVLTAIVDDKNKIEKYLSDFINFTGITGEILSITECSLIEANSLFRKADIGLQPLHRTEITYRLGISSLFGSNRMPIFRDELVQSTDEKKLKEQANCELFSDSLVEELTRISMGSVLTEMGAHPVHYIIKNNERRIQKQFLSTLLAGLASANRLQSPRYTLVEATLLMRPHFDIELLETVYQSSKGAVVVIDLTSVTDFRQQNWLSDVYKLVRDFHSSVLTILLVGEGRKVEVPLKEQFQNLTLITLEQGPVSPEKACEYVEYQLKKDNLIMDDQLLTLLPQKETTAEAVYDIYRQWQNHQRLLSSFPQYAVLTTANHDLPVKVAESSTANEELQHMIGLSEIKEHVTKATNYFKMQKLLKNRGIERETPAMHMLFTGNPGTAKTTVARLFARLMKESDVLKIGELIEVGRSELVGQFVGQTAPKVKTLFQKARGSVLFIDEAYSLVDGNANSYGQEAINVIVQEMENLREEVIVIFAGYPKEMSKFIDQNPGLKSRIAFQMNFADYEAEDLYAIAEVIATKSGLKLHPDVKGMLSDRLEKIKQADPENFGNGRTVRNLLEAASLQQANRIFQHDVNAMTDEEIQLLLPEDFSGLGESLPIQKQRSIGFFN